MTDGQIVDLYLARDEDAVGETGKKYGRYLFTVAYNVLGDESDAAECVNDAYLKAWESIHDARPASLSAYLGKITRNLAINRYKASKTKRRGGGQVDAALDEIGDLDFGGEMRDEADKLALRDTLNGFLKTLSKEKRGIFVARYWYFYPISEIARIYGISESKATVTLFRLRAALREKLEKEGLFR